MGTLDLTIQVFNLSPKVTVADLNSFLSYCGTIEDIKLLRNEDQSQLAFVTFREPYALQTALLLNGVVIVDYPIRVLPLQNLATPISDRTNNGSQNQWQGVFPMVQSVVQSVASHAYETLNRTKDGLEAKYRLSEKGRMLGEQTRLAISAAEQSAVRVGSVIMDNEYFSAGVPWLSSVLDKTAKRAAELGGHDKRRNPNSRKQK
ncbi:PREDICTED: protein vip1-like [Nelumbo nucifera]|uniref:Protein vip1-like n=2 Tax=Nelumbo nucifera TaxID=4432 RepID=A0A1U7ZP71_NELNU|nr:PREDICTED: protein vip1-like [Nelumbo nucifera]DAD34036.1 TPA_asm: hypothetical protein HUJ06_004676 [Nelumbo nucifera]